MAIRTSATNRSERLAHPEATTAALFAALAADGRFPGPEGELSVVFLSDPEIAAVHERYLGDATPTDVITFPAQPEFGSAGEILVSVDHAAERAAEFGTSFGRELTLYLIHGWLHLAGYTDKDDEGRAQMRGAEAEALDLPEAAAAAAEFRLLE